LDEREFHEPDLDLRGNQRADLGNHGLRVIGLEKKNDCLPSNHFLSAKPGWTRYRMSAFGAKSGSGWFARNGAIE
jgi:hypothetical protein